MPLDVISQSAEVSFCRAGGMLGHIYSNEGPLPVLPLDQWH